jgi:hypothetical protein
MITRSNSDVRVPTVLLYFPDYPVATVLYQSYAFLEINSVREDENSINSAGSRSRLSTSKLKDARESVTKSATPSYQGFR